MTLTEIVVQDIHAERMRQRDVEAITDEADDAHVNGELARAAACYAMVSVLDADDPKRAQADPGYIWPTSWSKEDWWKPTNSRRDLVKAAALIVAEIERLDRARIAHEELEAARNRYVALHFAEMLRKDAEARNGELGTARVLSGNGVDGSGGTFVTVVSSLISSFLIEASARLVVDRQAMLSLSIEKARK